MSVSVLLIALLASSSMAKDPAKHKANAASSDSTEAPHPRPSKIPIGECGCAFYAPPGATVDAPSTSEDGSMMWTSESDLGRGYHAGIVAVKFKEALADSTPEERGALLESYMDFLKVQVDVVGAAGYGRGHTLASEPAAVGVIDYWQDKDGDEWTVKGWVNADRLAVLYIRGHEQYPVVGWRDMFLDGFRFSAD